MPIQSKIDDDKLELRIYEAIGPAWAGMVDAQSVMAEIDKAADASEIVVKINSPGGSAFDGITIHNALKSHPAKVTTIAEGLAASAASLIFMAGNERKIHENATLLVHNASGIALGNASDMESVARDLRTLDASIAQTYATITGLDSDDVRATMDEDMLMNADDAIGDGYATEKISGEVPQMHFDKRFLNGLPQGVVDQYAHKDPWLKVDYAGHFRSEDRGAEINFDLTHKETDMTPDQFRAKHKDVVDGWLNDEASNAYANCKQDLAEMIQACGGNVESGYQAFLDGKSIADAQAEHNQAVADELAETKAKLEAAEAKANELENGSDEINLNAAAEIEGEASDEDKKRDAVKARAAKINGEYARNAYIVSSGYDPSDFDFED